MTAFPIQNPEQAVRGGTQLFSNLGTAELVEEAIRRGRGGDVARRRPGRRDGQAHRPLGQGQVHR